MTEFFEDDFCPPVSAAGSTAGSAVAGAAVSNASGGTAAVSLGWRQERVQLATGPQSFGILSVMYDFYSIVCMYVCFFMYELHYISRACKRTLHVLMCNT